MNGHQLSPIDQVIDEFVSRTQSGESPSIESYCIANPELADEIRKLFPVLAMLNTVVESETLVSKSSRSLNATREHTFEVPCEFGRYRLEKELGRGGMGTVYLAYDPQLDRHTAIKIPRFKSEKLAERFRREARLMAKVEHPSLCPIYDVGSIDGLDFLSMAFVEGRSLDEIIEESGSLTESEAAKIGTHVAEAVAAIHQSGMVHRDIKPGNVMISTEGRVFLMDFGLAFSPGELDESLTQEGEVVGSPAYLAPEQIESEIGEVGPQTDAYTLGVLLFEMVTGHRPFQGSAPRLMRQIATADPPKLSTIRADTSRRLDEICHKLLRRSPSDRLLSAGELANELRGFETQPESADSTFGGRRAMTWLATLFVFGLLVAGFVMTIRTHEGEVVVKAPDNSDLQIEVSEKGQRVALISKKNRWRVTVDHGEYEASILGDDKSVELSRERLTVKRGKTVQLEVVKKFFERPRQQSPLQKKGRANRSEHLPPLPVAEAASDGTFVDSDQRLGKSNSLAVKLGDLDGDGDLDAFVGCGEYEPDTVWLNDGKGNFSDSGQRLGKGSTGHVSLGDVDADGDLDAFTGARPQTQSCDLWINDGKGGFVRSEQELGNAYHIALEDFDQDGDLDGFLSVQQGPNRLLLNNGQGAFSDSGQRLGSHSSTYAAPNDFDRDGDIDLIVCNNRGAKDSLYVNEGSGEFALREIPFGSSETSYAVWIDAGEDIDTKPSVMTSDWKGFLRRFNVDPQGSTELISQIFSLYPFACSIPVDLTGNGRRDLVTVGTWKAPSAIGVEIEPASDRLMPFKAHYGFATYSWLDVGDLDGDGDLDLFCTTANNEPDEVWLNEPVAPQATPRFVASEQKIPTLGSWKCAAADFDNDGDVDLFFPSDMEGGKILLNDSSGFFHDSGERLNQIRARNALAADVDGDGDEDLFVGSIHEAARLWLNDGQARFTLSKQRFESRWALRSYAHDINGDGNVDLALVSHLGPSSVWFNDGDTNFPVSQQLEGEKQMGSDLGDLNGDGHVDIVIASANPPSIRLFFGDDQGRFKEQVRSISTYAAPLGIRDVNRDGNADLFLGGISRVAPPRVILGLGDEQFEIVPQAIPTFETVGVNFGDIDLDGDLDCVLGNYVGQPNQILLNDGKGRFELDQSLSTSHCFPTLADLDGDGDLDLVESAYANQALTTTGDIGTVRIWFNQTR